ncbi:hypothetical protein OIU78_019349 [Salix suchowensis]|nr:hypothetical protein OIU78_019349 [Salix suchowensis]
MEESGAAEVEPFKRDISLEMDGNLLLRMKAGGRPLAGKGKKKMTIVLFSVHVKMFPEKKDSLERHDCTRDTKSIEAVTHKWDNKIIHPTKNVILARAPP